MDDRHNPQPGPGTRSGATGPHAPAGPVIPRRRTPVPAAWHARTRPPAPGGGAGQPPRHGDGDGDGLIVARFRNRVHLPLSVLAAEAGYDIETAWQVLAALLQCG